MQLCFILFFMASWVFYHLLQLVSKTGVQPNVLTKDVGFNCEGEVCVISQDVCSFGEGDVLKVLTIDLHDLKQDRFKNEKHGSKESKLPEAQQG